MTQVGKRYVSPGGAEFIVTKGGPGTLYDGETPLVLKDASTPPPTSTPRDDAPEVQLGKRYPSADGARPSAAVALYCPCPEMTTPLIKRRLAKKTTSTHGSAATRAAAIR